MTFSRLSHWSLAKIPFITSKSFSYQQSHENFTVTFFYHKNVSIYLWPDELTCWKCRYFPNNSILLRYMIGASKTIFTLKCLSVDTKVLWQHSGGVTKSTAEQKAWFMCWPTHCWQKTTRLLPDNAASYFYRTVWCMRAQYLPNAAA